MASDIRCTDLRQDDLLGRYLAKNREARSVGGVERDLLVRAERRAQVTGQPHPVDVLVTRIEAAGVREGLVRRREVVDDIRRPVPDHVLVGALRLEDVPDVLPHLDVVAGRVPVDGAAVAVILGPRIPDAVHLVVESNGEGEPGRGDVLRVTLDVRVKRSGENGRQGVGRLGWFIVPRGARLGLPGQQGELPVRPRILNGIRAEILVPALEVPDQVGLHTDLLARRIHVGVVERRLLGVHAVEARARVEQLRLGWCAHRGCAGRAR